MGLKAPLLFFVHDAAVDGAVHDRAGGAAHERRAAAPRLEVEADGDAKPQNQRLIEAEDIHEHVGIQLVTIQEVRQIDGGTGPLKGAVHSSSCSGSA